MQHYDSCIINDLFTITPASRESFPQKDSGRAGMTKYRTLFLHLSIVVLLREALGLKKKRRLVEHNDVEMSGHATAC